MLIQHISRRDGNFPIRNDFIGMHRTFKMFRGVEFWCCELVMLVRLLIQVGVWGFRTIILVSTAGGVDRKSEYPIWTVAEYRTVPYRTVKCPHRHTHTATPQQAACPGAHCQGAHRPAAQAVRHARNPGYTNYISVMYCIERNKIRPYENRILVSMLPRSPDVRSTRSVSNIYI